MTKQIEHINKGFDIDESNMNKMPFPFQKFCVKRALKAESMRCLQVTRLGKTVMQLEWSQKVLEKENRSVLILAPLVVVGQTINEGLKFGYKVSEIETETSGNGIYITN